MKIEPSLSASRFSQVEPGSIVQIDGRRALVASQQANKVLAKYDVAQSKFEYSVADDLALLLVFDGEVIFRPDLSSAFDGHPSDASTNEAYMVDARPHVVLHGVAGFRLLDLSTGTIEPTQRSSMMTGFRKWEICVRGAGGESFTLMKFASSARATDRAALAAAARDKMAR
jgi:hypothetical protein